MAEQPKPKPSASARAGLCDTCAHQQEVRNTRGSVFSLCTRSRVDPAYPRYPRVPVLDCAGYERREQ
ncbi:MAG TPA: hypothetical protein VK774_04745 [Solirubrobacteraceae bacterium]|nr:hypothetical protein [Solirubrobacteraceae bacterium]